MNINDEHKDGEYKIEPLRKEGTMKNPAAASGTDPKDYRFFAILVVIGMSRLIFPVVLVSLHFGNNGDDNTEYLFQSEGEMKKFWERQGWSDIYCVQQDSADHRFNQHSCSVTVRNKTGEAGHSRKLVINSVRSSGKIYSIATTIPSIPDNLFLFPSETAMKEYWKKEDLFIGCPESKRETNKYLTSLTCISPRMGPVFEIYPMISRSGQVFTIGMHVSSSDYDQVIYGFDLLAKISNTEAIYSRCSNNFYYSNGGKKCVDSSGTYFWAVRENNGKKFYFSVESPGKGKKPEPLSWDNVSSVFKQIMPDRSTDIIHCVNNYSGAGLVGCKADSGLDFMAVENSSIGTVTYSATAGQPLTPQKKSIQTAALFSSEIAMKKYWEQNGWENNITGCASIKNTREHDSGETEISCTFRAPTEDEDPAFFDAQGRPEESEFKLNVLMRSNGQVVRISFEDVPYNKANQPHAAPYFNSLAFLANTDFLDACENSDRWLRSDKRTGNQICDTSSGVTFSKIITSYGQRAVYSVTSGETR